MLTAAADPLMQSNAPPSCQDPPRISTMPFRSYSRLPKQIARMLENIAKALTRRLRKDESGIGARDVSERVTVFVRAVRNNLGT